MVTFIAREGRPEEGVSPTMRIAEYGPKGRTGTTCSRCTAAARAATATATPPTSGAPRPRRASAAASIRAARSVITDLKWDTTGGTGDRDSGLFPDFKVTFTMEVKKFATQFTPGSTECVPK